MLKEAYKLVNPHYNVKLILSFIASQRIQSHLFLDENYGKIYLQVSGLYVQFLRNINSHSL